MDGSEDETVTALRAACDQYGMAMRDMMAGDPVTAAFARAIAETVAGQCPAVDGRALTAAALAARRALTLFRQAGAEITAVGALNLVALAGRVLTEDQEQDRG